MSIQDDIRDVCANGGYKLLPPGDILFPSGIFASPTKSVTLIGAGENATRLIFLGGDGLSLTFQQEGLQQPHGLVMKGISLVAAQGVAGAALRVSYGNPDATSDHFHPSVSLSDIRIESSDTSGWDNGIILEGAWNATLQNVFISGCSFGGEWDKLIGAGITLLGSCVNAHLANVRCNFFATGLLVDAGNGPNTEGIFCSNCSFVAVKRGVRIRGNPAHPVTQRISTFTWHGGLIETRFAGVRADSQEAGIFVGIWLENVWTVLMCGMQVLADCLPEGRTTYAVLLSNCRGICVNACDLNAFTHGVHGAGECSAIAAAGNTFTNVAEQVIFAPDCMRCKSGGNVVVDGPIFEWTHNPAANYVNQW